jgi:hypothetical protein
MTTGNGNRRSSLSQIEIAIVSIAMALIKLSIFD